MGSMLKSGCFNRRELARPSMVGGPSITMAVFMSHEDCGVMAGIPDLLVRYFDDTAIVRSLDAVGAPEGAYHKRHFRAQFANFVAISGFLNYHPAIKGAVEFLRGKELGLRRDGNGNQEGNGEGNAHWPSLAYQKGNRMARNRPEMPLQRFWIFPPSPGQERLILGRPWGAGKAPRQRKK